MASQTRPQLHDENNPHQSSFYHVPIVSPFWKKHTHKRLEALRISPQWWRPNRIPCNGHINPYKHGFFWPSCNLGWSNRSWSCIFASGGVMVRKSIRSGASRPLWFPFQGFQLVMGVPPSHPFRTMGYSMKFQQENFGVAPWRAGNPHFSADLHLTPSGTSGSISQVGVRQKIVSDSYVKVLEMR